jgi:hypothetical protein
MRAHNLERSRELKGGPSMEVDVRLHPRYHWQRLVALPFLSLLLLGGCAPFGVAPSASPATSKPAATATPTPTFTPPPTATPATVSYPPFAPLLTQVSAAGPVYVTADAGVPRAALDAAGAMLAAMVRHRPDVVATLQAHGTLTAVVSRTEMTCDLPYFAAFRGSSVCATYVAGAGGTPALPVTACSERNLLQEPDDPYGRGTQPYSENICVHELAHTIMDVGLSAAERDQIQARYTAAQRAGLWRGDYAMTNAQEFFAVLTQCYFWAAPAVATAVHPYAVNGPDALQRYDPASFALLDSIYHGPSDLR